MAAGLSAIVTGPVAVSIVTGNPACKVVVGAAVVSVTAVRTVVLVAELAHAERTAEKARARKEILLKKTSSLSEDEGCRSVRKPHDFAFIRDASCVPKKQAAWLASLRSETSFQDPNGHNSCGTAPGLTPGLRCVLRPPKLGGAEVEYRFEVRSWGFARKPPFQSGSRQTRNLG